MDLFLAQNHAPMTHLPIASAVLAAAAAIAAVFFKRKELVWAWSVLSVVAFVSVIPTVITGIQAAKGRHYIEQGFIVTDTAENSDIRLHQQLGMAGAAVGAFFLVLGIRSLRGKPVNRHIAAALALSLAILWGATGCLGGRAIWGADTFPAFEQTEYDE